MGIGEEVQWVGHNISKFDAKWLVRHGIKSGLAFPSRFNLNLKSGLAFPSRFNLNRYRGNVRDTMTMWGCGDYQDHTKLDDLARFLGVGKKTKGIDGSQVWQYYKDGKLDEIKSYCADDVELTRAVFKNKDGKLDEIKSYCADDVELTRAVFKKLRGYILD